MKRKSVAGMSRSAICGVLWLLSLACQAALPDVVAFGNAIERGDLGAARRWLDEGLDANLEADRIGTGLMIAAWQGNIPMMELFFARGADPQRVNRQGEQALQLAAWRGQIEAVRWLLDHGAAINRQGAAWSALHYAVFAGHRDVADLLIQRGADVNGRAPNGSTVLMMAAREGKEELARALIAAGADPRPANDAGDTALTWAMRYGNLRVARLVSSPEAFARAAQASPESFGQARKSQPAPSEISQLLEKIREAEGRGEDTEALRQRLTEAIARFRAQSTVINLAGKKKPAKQPALVITAQRKGGGERAEIVDKAPAAAMTPAARAAEYEAGQVEEFAVLVERLNQARAAGRPTADLQRQVSEAYQRLKVTPAK